MMARNFIAGSLLFTLLMVLPLSAKINFVQQNYKTSKPSGSSLVVAYPAAQTAGNLNIVVVGWNDTTAAVSAVIDSNQNSYIPAVGPTAGEALTQTIYYARNIAGGSNTVTVTFNQTATYPDVRVLEYSGADPTGPLDVTAAAASTGLTANSGSATTNTLSELVFGAGMTFTSFSTAGSGFTNRIITNFGDIAEDATVLSAGSYSVTAPLTSAAPWLMQMATFQSAGQGSSNPAPTVSSITPSSGPASGGTAVTITGTGFLSGATVTLGGTAATGVNVVNSTSITSTTPAHAAGTVGVVVKNTDNQAGTLSGGYTYTSSGGGGGISFVQVKSAVANSGGSIAVTYPGAQTAGNLNVVAVMWGDSTSTVSSVTDSKGNSYTLAVGPTRITGVTQSIYYAKNIVGGSNTVTVTFNQTAAFPNVNVLEYSGLSTTNPLDVFSSASGSGTTANSGAATTTSANELIFGAGSTSNAFTAAGSGFSNRIINSFGDISEDQIVSNTGSYNATATLTSGTWVMQMVAFRASGQAQSPPPPPPPPPPDPRHSVSLFWDAPATAAAYYKVYRGTVTGGSYSLLSTNVTSTTYEDSTVQSGATYYYVTTTVNAAGLESIFSNELKSVIPTP
jgi:IPT/TIG domain-containing protein